MFFGKDVHVFAKTYPCFAKNIYIFWRAPALKISKEGLAHNFGHKESRIQQRVRLF